MNLHGPNFQIHNISHIIFDKDGTISDAHVYWSEIIRRRSYAICTALDLPFSLYSSKLELCMGLGADGLLSSDGPIAIKSRSEVISILTSMLRRDNIFVTEDLINTIFSVVHHEFAPISHQYIKPIHSALSFISQAASAGISLSLATSDSTQNTLTSLMTLELYNIFSPAIVCCDSGFGDKRNGEPAKALCEMRGFSPSETICIGDAPMDFLMSESSSLKSCILTSTGQIPFDTLKSVTSNVCHSLSEILIEP